MSDLMDVILESERLRRQKSAGVLPADRMEFDSPEQSFQATNMLAPTQGAMDYANYGSFDGPSFLQRWGNILSAPVGRQAQPGDRGVLFPGKVGDDGKVGAAVPGLIMEPVESWQRMMESPITDIMRSGDDKAKEQLAVDSFNVAGAVPMAGVAVGKAAGAVRKSAADRTQELGPLYRGSSGRIGDDSPAREFFWATPDKNVASDYASQHLPADHLTPRVQETYARFRNPKRVDAKGKSYEDVHTEGMAYKYERDGHDGLIIDNVFDPPSLDWMTENNVTQYPTSRVVAALGRNTMYDRWGNKVFSNPDDPTTAGILNLMDQGLGPNLMTPTTENAKVAAGLFPPKKSARPFDDDYPEGAKGPDGSPLEYDIEGRPLVAPIVAGRRTVGGADEGISSSQANQLAEWLVSRVEPSAELNDRRLAGVYGRSGPDGSYIAYNNRLSDGGIANTIAHEAGHAIGDKLDGDLGRTAIGASKESRKVYNDLSSMGQAHETKPSRLMGPEQYGYKPNQVDAELIAESLRAYMQDPNYIKTVAPGMAKRIRAAVNSDPNISKWIQFNANAPDPTTAAILDLIASESSRQRQ